MAVSQLCIAVGILQPQGHIVSVTAVVGPITLLRTARFLIGHGRYRLKDGRGREGNRERELPAWAWEAQVKAEAHKWFIENGGVQWQSDNNSPGYLIPCVSVSKAEQYARKFAAEQLREVAKLQCVDCRNGNLARMHDGSFWHDHESPGVVRHNVYQTVTLCDSTSLLKRAAELEKDGGQG